MTCGLILLLFLSIAAVCSVGEGLRETDTYDIVNVLLLQMEITLLSV